MFKNKNFVDIFDTSFNFCFDSLLILVFFDFDYLHSRYAKFFFENCGIGIVDFLFNSNKYYKQGYILMAL